MRKNAKSAALQTLLLEAAVVGVAGLGFALLANQLSPRGLVLARDYFGGTAGMTPKAAVVAASPPTVPSLAAGGDRAREVEINRDGFRIAKLDEILRWHADPRRERGLIMFVDARGDRAFRDGHIPGAVQFDPFYPEQRLAEVLAACSLADQIVVYCTGGDCIDSNLAARLLRDAGVPLERLAVFAGGISDWKTAGAPIELGTRNSGILRTP
ncbi:MAG: rhodanese-like domain-containing protein [Opitutaceae bacterium]|nr:rhodanese-like domain-containing protein [Opitutaceae bacterium]